MKLLIVDDEQHVVEYIKHILDWEKIGFHSVMGVTKSKSALEYLLSEKPELMITDIQMPVLSGLDLAEAIVEHKLLTKVIILSGYSDFSYAQRAIQLGIVDYLIKPITPKELLPVVNRAKTTILASNHGRLLTLKERNRFFLELLNSIELPEPNLMEGMLFTLSEIPHLGMLNLRIGMQYLTLFSQELIGQFSEYDTSKASPQKIRMVFHSLVTESANFEASDFFELVQKENWQLLLNRLTLREREGLNFQEKIDVFWMLSKSFPQLLDTVDLSELLNSSEFTFFFTDFLSNLLLIKEAPYEERAYEEQIIKNILQYIREHYSEELSLDQLGERFHMHPVTISRNFKAITGGTFLNYLKKYRMKEATKLLIHSNMLVGDIGKLVGYKTARYFSDIFREAYGMTPREYRRKMQNWEGIDYEF